MQNLFFNTILQIIIYAGIIQGFYSALILTHSKKKNPANQYLSILLIILSFSILHSIFVIPYFHHSHAVDFQIKEPFILLVIPVLWLYIKKLNEPLFIFRKKHFLHFLPFLVVMSISFIFLNHGYQLTDKQKFYLIFNILVYIVALCQYFFYLFYMLKILRAFNKKAYNELSNFEKIDPEWLKIFLISFISVLVLLIVMMVIAVHQLNWQYFNTAVSLVFSIIIFVLGYKGLFQETISIVSVSTIVDKKSDASIKMNGPLLTKLSDYMSLQKPFKDPELTLTSLAQKLELSRNVLSDLINSGTGGNFYDFVNKYRVEEVKKLMEDSKYKDYTILAIAFEAGFPSKSTFNSIFKKFTGYTPSEYRAIPK